MWNTIESSSDEHAANNGRETVISPRGITDLVSNSVNGVPRTHSPAIKVLMYHRIVENRELVDSSAFCVHKDEFHKQLEVLTQLGFTPVTFYDYYLNSRGEILLPKKPVILTFDDGYMDTYSLAYPLLEEYGMKAVVFALGDRRLKTNLWDSYDMRFPSSPLMEDHHLTELLYRGFEIGSHSLSHMKLPFLSTDEAYVEIQSPKVILESVLGTPVRTFSYPYGLLNRRIKEITRDCGYDYACSVGTGPVRFGSDLFEIRRITVRGKMTIPEFVLRLITPVEFAEWLWWKAKVSLVQSRVSR